MGRAVEWAAAATGGREAASEELGLALAVTHTVSRLGPRLIGHQVELRMVEAAQVAPPLQTLPWFVVTLVGARAPSLSRSRSLSLRAALRFRAQALGFEFDRTMKFADDWRLDKQVRPAPAHSSTPSAPRAPEGVTARARLTSGRLTTTR